MFDNKIVVLQYHDIIHEYSTGLGEDNPRRIKF